MTYQELFHQALSVWDDALLNLCGAHQAAKLAAWYSWATHQYWERGMRDMKIACQVGIYDV